MLPLLSSYGHNPREKSYIIGITTSSLLASSEVLAQQPGYPSLWLRFIDVLCRFIREGGAIGEMTTERMKNLLMVMMVEKRFDTMSAVAGQNVLEATMMMLDSYCPAIRQELDMAFNRSENPKGEKEGVEEKSQEKSEEKSEQQSEEKSEEMSPEKPEQQSEEKPEQKSEEKPEQQSEQQSEEKPEEEKENENENVAIPTKEEQEMRDVQQKEENVQSTTQSIETQNGEDVIIQVKE